jgi:hypothetical protein
MDAPVKNLSLRIRPQRKNGPKYSLIEREITPEEQRSNFVAQDARFCAAMLAAIAYRMENPWKGIR